MEKNLFTSVFRRENKLQKAIFDFFYGIASYPRLVLEVFIRRNMGQRYFTIASAVTVAFILLSIPVVIYGFEQLISYSYSGFRGYGGYGDYGGNRNHQESSFLSRYGTWYIFSVLFIVFSRQRAKETYISSNVYNYNRFTLSSGNRLGFFYNLPFFKNKPSAYELDVFIEPGFFVLIGFVLELMGQPIGMLLMISAICYGFSYAAGYKIQDDYFLDLIDKIILNEEMVNAFVHGIDPKLTRGVELKSRPSDEKLRRKMVPKFFPEDKVNDAEYLVT